MKVVVLGGNSKLPCHFLRTELYCAHRHSQFWSPQPSEIILKETLPNVDCICSYVAQALMDNQQRVLMHETVKAIC